VKPTQQLHDLGQSHWLDNIMRDLLNTGTLHRYIADLSVTGLTSNPSIFDLAFKTPDSHDDAIRRKTAEGKSVDFAALRYDIGGHVEKPAGSSGQTTKAN
jgi:transaldolase